MLRWSDIDTVLLDMDGTILDLNFDTRFWLHHVPTVYGARHGLDRDGGWQLLEKKLRRVEGTLQWYCLDYWREQLDLDLLAMKDELAHLIRYRDGAREFLVQLRTSRQRVILVTNAHSHSLALKLRHTDLDEWLDETIVSHDFGHAKEDANFWQRLRAVHPFDPQRTLFVDDSLPVLRAAQRFGIEHLLAIAKPDSQCAARDTAEFTALHEFAAISPPF